MNTRYESWGRYPKRLQKASVLGWCPEKLELSSTGTVLPYGKGRSYGDVCLNTRGRLLDAAALNRFISFDEQTGILHCEAGVTIGEILKTISPKGWFLPVVPGTGHVTVGGAAANDIHGKNHHFEGTFGRHLLSLELLRSDGAAYRCSRKENPELFSATIGGLGLTGLMTRLEIQMKRCEGPMIETESISFSDLNGLLKLSESDQDSEYTVAWVDVSASGDSFGRGVYFRGRHVRNAPKTSVGSGYRKISIPFDLPKSVVTPGAVKIFNAIYSSRHTGKKTRTVYYPHFFFPLDALGNWNRLYGPQGFFQYQAVVPMAAGFSKAEELLRIIADSGLASVLAVLKKFGSLASPGKLSFPREGWSVAVDLLNEGEASFKLMETLDGIVRACGGAVYPAKDARMSMESFEAFFPQWPEFLKWKDPLFESDFFRRMTRFSKTGG